MSKAEKDLANKLIQKFRLDIKIELAKAKLLEEVKKHG